MLNLSVIHNCAQGDILEDIELIENLEETKKTAMDIEEKVKLAKVTEVNIAKAREVYRPVATRGSLTYFLIDNLNALDRVYHYSMANFVFVLIKGMDMTPGGKDESKVWTRVLRAALWAAPLLCCATAALRCAACAVLPALRCLPLTWSASRPCAAACCVALRCLPPMPTPNLV
jgi:hypothetical protein